MNTEQAIEYLNDNKKVKINSIKLNEREELHFYLSNELKTEINDFLFTKVRDNLTIKEFEELACKINDLIWDSFNKDK